MDRFITHLENMIVWIITAGVGAVASGAWWLIRRVFTNQQQIDLLIKELKHRDQLRQEDREDMTEVKASVKRIEGVLLSRGNRSHDET